MRPKIEVESAGASELFAPRMADDSIVAMRLRDGLEDPIVIGVVPIGRARSLGPRLEGRLSGRDRLR